jgi:hypothetical protein
MELQDVCNPLRIGEEILSCRKSVLKNLALYGAEGERHERRKQQPAGPDAAAAVRFAEQPRSGRGGRTFPETSEAQSVRRFLNLAIPITP